jgi:hypothetical protein
VQNAPYLRQDDTMPYKKKCGIDEIPPDTYEYEIPLHVRSGTTEEYHQL